MCLCKSDVRENFVCVPVCILQRMCKVFLSTGVIVCVCVRKRAMCVNTFFVHVVQGVFLLTGVIKVCPCACACVV